MGSPQISLIRRNGQPVKNQLLVCTLLPFLLFTIGLTAQTAKQKNYIAVLEKQTGESVDVRTFVFEPELWLMLMSGRRWFV